MSVPALMGDDERKVLDDIDSCEMIDLLLPDMNGLLRGKRITRDALEKVYADGVCLPMSLIATDITGNTVEETGLGYAIGDEDRICRPVPGHHRRSGQFLHPRLRQDRHLPLARRCGAAP